MIYRCSVCGKVYASENDAELECIGELQEITIEQIKETQGEDDKIVR